MNEAALETTLTALRDLGRLTATDEALVALCKSTARAVDDAPGRAGLVQQYRECLVALGERGSEEPDGLDDLLADLGRTEVGSETET